MTPTDTGTGRIRWEDPPEPSIYASYGYVGSLDVLAFKIFQPNEDRAEWVLTTTLPRMERECRYADAPGKLKAAADELLSEFVSSLGAFFPEPESVANYDNLTSVQQARFDALMTQPTNQWPPELIQWVRNTPGAFCGDALADTVAGWVRSPETPSKTAGTETGK